MKNIYISYPAKVVNLDIDLFKVLKSKYTDVHITNTLVKHEEADKLSYNEVIATKIQDLSKADIMVIAGENNIVDMELEKTFAYHLGIEQLYWCNGELLTKINNTSDNKLEVYRIMDIENKLRYSLDIIRQHTELKATSDNKVRLSHLAWFDLISNVFKRFTYDELVSVYNDARYYLATGTKTDRISRLEFKERVTVKQYNLTLGYTTEIDIVLAYIINKLRYSLVSDTEYEEFEKNYELLKTLHELRQKI